MPPLWQYFSRLRKKAHEPIAAPKGHGPPDPAAFPLQSCHFWGPLEGTIIALLDPKPARRGIGAKAMPPLWQYSRDEQGRRYLGRS
jgi:hypothetical protein